jgi:hypothetical protein
MTDQVSYGARPGFNTTKAITSSIRYPENCLQNRRMTIYDRFDLARKTFSPP